MLNNFTVIDILNTRSDSVVNINGTGMKFNMQTAEELNYPPYVQFLISNTKDKQFAIRVCKENDPNAVAFSKPKGEQKHFVMVRNAAIISSIRRIASWEGDNWNVPGLFCPDDMAILYELKAAKKPVSKGGWEVKRRNEAAAAKVATENEAKE